MKYILYVCASAPATLWSHASLSLLCLWAYRFFYILIVLLLIQCGSVCVDLYIDSTCSYRTMSAIQRTVLRQHAHDVFASRVCLRRRKCALHHPELCLFLLWMVLNPVSPATMCTLRPMWTHNALDINNVSDRTLRKWDEIDLSWVISHRFGFILAVSRLRLISRTKNPKNGSGSLQSAGSCFADVI